MYDWYYTEEFQRYDFQPKQLASFEKQLRQIYDAITGKFKLGVELDNATGQFHNTTDHLMSDDLESIVKSVGGSLHGDFGKRRLGLPLGLISTDCGEVQYEKRGALEYAVLTEPKKAQIEHVVPNAYAVDILIYLYLKGFWKMDVDETGNAIGVNDTYHNKLANIMIKNMFTTIVSPKQNTDLRNLLHEWVKKYVGVYISEVGIGKAKDYSKLLTKLHNFDHYKHLNIRFHPAVRRIQRGTRPNYKNPKVYHCYPDNINSHAESLINYDGEIVGVNRDYDF